MVKQDNSTVNLLITIFGIIAIIFVVYALFLKEDRKVIGIKLPNSSSELSIGDDGASFKVDK